MVTQGFSCCQCFALALKGTDLLPARSGRAGQCFALALKGTDLLPARSGRAGQCLRHWLLLKKSVQKP